MSSQFQTISKIQDYSRLRVPSRNPFSADFAKRLLLSVGLGIFVPGSGALTYGMGDVPSWTPIHATLADQSFFGQIAVVAFGLTLALMLEMRFAGVMGRREERERRMVFRWEDRKLAKRGHALRKRTLPSTHYLRLGSRATIAAAVVVAADALEWHLAWLSLLLAGAWLAHAWNSRHREARADEQVPFHPVTLIAAVLGGISLVFLGHHLLPSLEPANTKTATAIYGIVSGVLASGYVVFAGDHRLERHSGLLPNLHTVGVQCAVVGLAGLGLGGALLAAEHSGGWFAFWMTVVSTPAMLTQAYLVRSSSIRT